MALAEAAVIVVVLTVDHHAATRRFARRRQRLVVARAPRAVAVAVKHQVGLALVHREAASVQAGGGDCA